MKWITSLLVALPLFLYCQGQKDTVIVITDAAIVIATPNSLAPLGFKVREVDSITMVEKQTQGIDQVLATESAIYLKSYGVGSLSTISFRGMGANHTRLLWNGMVLNSSMNGTIDLTTLPAGLFDRVELQYGNSSLQTGSGGIGGGVQLFSKPDWRKKHSVLVTQEVGSFHSWRGAAKITVGNRQWQSNTSLMYVHQQNDFTFRNVALFGEPQQKQTRAAFQQYGLVQEVHGRFKNNELSLIGWVAWAEREIPPTMISSDNMEGQKDVLLFAAAEWTKHFQLSILQAKSNYKFDKIRYSNALLQLDTASYTHTLSNILTYDLPFKKWRFSARFDNQNQVALSGYYSNGKKRQLINGLFAGATFIPIQPIELLLYLRQELIDNQLSPFLPSFGLNIKLLDKRAHSLAIHGNWHRNYRYPTLNDRYWAAGGNPDLKQEVSMGTEGGIGFSKWLKSGKIAADITGFYLLVDNWILWQPGNFGYWSPENIRKVKSRGLEASLQFDGQKADWRWWFRSNYQFVKATVLESTNGNDLSIGNDLIYTPRHVASGYIRVAFQGWYLSYNHQFTGKRYTTSDNSESLQAFTTGEIIVGKQFLKALKGLDIFVNVKNLWNESYQNIAWRPMPGRAYYGGIRFSWGKDLQQ
ncbi:MAG: TonB-dependent receptor plug domain-containing protein [Chitinophagales bacterium]|nr:TonB-dependent receptor plug domain-containing protein [Chitinophagales bacterium]